MQAGEGGRCEGCETGKPCGGLAYEGGTFEQSLVRFRIRAGSAGHAYCPGCALLGKKKGLFWESFHTALALVGHRRAARMYGVLRKIGLVAKGRLQCYHHWRSVLKKMTSSVKLGGNYITPHWRDFSYWETFFGYYPYRDINDLEDYVKRWLVDRHWTQCSLVTEAQYNDWLEQELRSFLREEWRCPETVLPIGDWLKKGDWMRGKAGDGDVARYRVRGKLTRAGRNKGFDAVVYTDANIKRQMFHAAGDKLQVMQKSEPGKVRGCVKAGNNLFRQMDFLSQWVEGGLYSSRTSTLFAGKRGNEEIDEELVESMQHGGWVKVPLDQSGFDNNQARSSVLRVIKVLRDYLEPNVRKVDGYDQVWDAVERSVNDPNVTVVLGEKQWRWGNGVPSGWRWTALLDTLLNICSFRVILRCIRDFEGLHITTRGTIAQGDDLLFEVKELSHAERICDWYSRFGFEVNPYKTHFSESRGEFLRRSFDAKGVVGYLPRTILALRFRNPIKMIPPHPILRLQSRFSLWHLATVRGALVDRAATLFLEDVAQTRIEPSIAARVACTPASVGGWGVVPYSGWWRALQGSTTRWSRIMVTEDDPPSISAELGAWNERMGKDWWASLDAETRQNALRTLALTWGAREAAVRGRISYKEVRVPVRRAARSNACPAPDLSRMWEGLEVPVVMSEFAKKRLLEENDQLDFIVDPYVRETALWLKKRISKTLFTMYAMGHCSVAVPTVDGFSPRYGFKAKQRASYMLLQVVGTKDADMDLYQSGRLYIERWLACELTGRAAEHIWGV